MTPLMILILRQRARRLQRQYGWPAALSLAGLLMLVLWTLASVASRLLSWSGSSSSLAPVLGGAWISWMVMGVITGRDLTWHMRIERLFVFRVPFYRMYLLDAILGFVSYPVFVLTAAVIAYNARDHRSAAQCAISLLTLCAAIVITRAGVSMIRTVLFRGRALDATTRVAALVAVIVVLSIPVASMFFYATRIDLLLPIAVVLSVGDYALQRIVLRSGVRGAAPKGSLFGRFQEWLLLAGPSRPSILWRVAMLGWLRNRNALLLFIWGTAYGFLYTWFTRATGLSYYISFIWMVLIFHSYLRGNLFGIDQKGVWFYFLQPVPLKHVLRAKSATMTLLQCIMVSAVLFPALLRVTAGMTTAFSWACVLGFAAAALLVSDIAGQFFSVLHPDPIERGSLYSGGMTLGAIVIPFIHVVLAVFYLILAHLTKQSDAQVAGWSFMIGLPLVLAAIRWAALPIWIQQLLRRDREEILSQLSAVTP